MSKQGPVCFVFSAQGAGLALKLQTLLVAKPWRQCGPLSITAPAKLLQRNPCVAGILPFSRLPLSLSATLPLAPFLIFIGAAGIVVRAIAPFLSHKELDPPVLVIDPRGEFVISLISGHWGGGNALARHIAGLINAQPVITTASDISGALPLDLLLQAAGLRIIDWQELPALQGRLLEGHLLTYSDPWRILPPRPELCRKTLCACPDIFIHWRWREPQAGLMRAALPVIHIGIGMRRNVQFAILQTALANLLAQYQIERAAIKSIATVSEKEQEPALRQLAANAGIPIQAFPSAFLATVQTPNPSAACGRRFGQPPFSVCEASALAAAQKQGQRAFLLACKHTFAHCITMAIAIASPPGRQTLVKSAKDK